MLDEPPGRRHDQSPEEQLEDWLLEDRPWREGWGSAKCLSDDPLLSGVLSWFLWGSKKGRDRTEVCRGVGGMLELCPKGPQAEANLNTITFTMGKLLQCRII